MSHTIAFVMDPLDRVSVDVDTSFAFMLAAMDRGCRLLHVSPENIDLEGTRVVLRGHYVEVFDRSGSHFNVLETGRVEAADCAAIFIRTDPPFDESYLTVTWLLDFAERQGTRVINSPRGIRSANEKLYALEFPELCPPTIVSCERERILRFVEEMDGCAIGKPLDGHGGFGVVRLQRGDSNLKALIDMLTLEGKQPLLAQRFLTEASEGDKRLLMIDGHLRGAIRRVPQSDDHRGNVHVGGRVEACELDDADRRIEAAMGDRLRADGLCFVGLDVIAGYLIEVNVTSPTLVREIKRLGGPDIAAEVIDGLL